MSDTTDRFFKTLEEATKNITLLPQYQAAEVIPLIDLTLLNLEAPNSAIYALQKKAEQSQVAAICIYPEQLHLVENSFLKKATVLNFPSGQENHQDLLLQLNAILETSAVDEIDYVFDYVAFTNGHKEDAFNQCREICEIIHYQQKKLKVILETGFQNDTDIIYQLSRMIIDTGCDFLKTSTGKIAVGATPSAVNTMLTALKDSDSSCGIKVSGGVQTYQQANYYLHLAEHILEKKVNSNWFRLGASTLLDNLLQLKANENYN